MRSSSALAPSVDSVPFAPQAVCARRAGAPAGATRAGADGVAGAAPVAAAAAAPTAPTPPRTTKALHATAGAAAAVAAAATRAPTALSATRAPSAAPRKVLSRTAALYLQASIVMIFLAASSALTPLYAVYQARWGFSPVTTTAIFGVYALAVLGALLTVGSLSDHVGRRPVLLVAVVAQAITMLLFAGATGVPMLITARIVQGLSTGAAVGAIGAGMLDLDRQKGTLANSIGPMLGTATGGIVSGLFVQFLPAPTHLVYLVLFAVLLLQLAGVARMPETVSPRPGALASLKPRFRLPPAVRPAVLMATPALVAAWALAGFYGSLGPVLVRRLAGSGALALGGLALFVLALSGVVAVLVTRQRPARQVLLLGTALLVVGVGVTLGAVALGSLALLFAGTAIAGMGFGSGFQGAIRTVVPLAEAHERAGVLSVLYVISYLAMGLPAVIAGALVVHGGGFAATTREFALAVMALAALAFVSTGLTSRSAART